MLSSFFWKRLARMVKKLNAPVDDFWIILLITGIFEGVFLLAIYYLLGSIVSIK